MKKITRKEQLSAPLQDTDDQGREKLENLSRELEAIEKPTHRSRHLHWPQVLGVVLLACIIGGGFVFIRHLMASPAGIPAQPTSLAVQNHSGWCQVPIIGLNTSVGTSAIKGVAAVSANDIWAVGTLGNRSLIEHWDGSRLAVVASPQGGGNSENLMGVAAIATNDVWAVGITIAPPPGLSIVHPLIEHWDGRQWYVVPDSTATSKNGGLLQSIAAVSSNDIWATGYTVQHGTTVALIEHWDGHRWNTVSLPVSLQKIALTAVTAVAKRDIWVAGISTDAKKVPGAAHWDGSQWKIFSDLGVSSKVSDPVVLSASAANDIWFLARSTAGQSWFAHWDGAQWQMVSGPSLKPVERLTGIVTIAPDNAWAIGGDIDNSNNSASGQTVLEHWDGKNWKLVTQIRPETGGFSAIVAIDRKLWLFGTVYAGLQQVPNELAEVSC